MNMKIHYIIPKQKFDDSEIENIKHELLKIDSKKLNIFYSYQYENLYKIIREFLKDKNIISLESIHSKKENVILGCDFFKLDYDVLAIVENNFHLIPVLHSSVRKARNIYFLNPLIQKLEKIEFIKDIKCKKYFFDLSPSFYSKFYLNQLERKKFQIKYSDLVSYAEKEIRKIILKLINEKNIGVIISSKIGQKNFLIYYKLKSLFEKTDKLLIPIIFDKIEDLENFYPIKLFINTACPRIAEDHENVINAYDLIKIIENEKLRFD